MTEMMILTIDLGQTKGDITIFRESVPETLAKDFCRKFKLNSSIESSLTQYLQRHIKATFASPSSPPKPTQISSSSSSGFNDLSMSTNSGRQSRTPASDHPRLIDPKTPDSSMPGERLFQKAMGALNKKFDTEVKIPTESIEEATTDRNLSANIRLAHSGLLKSVNKSKERFIQLKKQCEKDRIKECSFRPQTNSRAMTRSESKNRNIELYESYKIKQERLLNKSELLLKQKCPFTPQINTHNKEKVNLSQTIDRLLKFKERRQSNLEKIRESQRKLEQFDPETGKALFKPQVLSKSRNDKGDKSIWESLYYKRSKNNHSPIPSPRKVFIDKNSQKINQKIRYRQFSKIFNELSNNTSSIKYSEIDFKSADKQMVDILYPMIQELAESRTELSFEDFCEALDALFKLLTPQDKWYLIFTFKSENSCMKK